MIGRRTLIQGAGAGLLAAPFLNLRAQEVHKLRFSTFMPNTSNVYANIHKPWMERIEKESGGRLKFEPYPSMQLGGTPAQLFDQARDGVSDISFALSGYAAGRLPTIELFELPGFTYDGEGSSKALWEFAMQHAMGDFKDVHVLALHNHGLNVVHTRTKALKSIADFKGVKIRGASRTSTQILNALGAIPVGMPLPQIPDALSKGVIEGAVVPWDTVPPAKLNELTSFHTEFAKGLPGYNNSTQFMVMNKKRYQALPADLQKIIDKNSGLEFSGLSGRIIAGGDDPVRKMVIEKGSTVTALDKSEFDQFMRKTAGVIDSWIQDMNKRGQDGKKLYEAGQALIEKHRPKA